MKHFLLIFTIIFLTLIAGCKGPHQGATDPSSVTNGDTTAHRGGLFDSIHDTRLRGIVANDSIELLAVHHVVDQGDAIEQILYIDRNAARHDKFALTHGGFGPMTFDSGTFMRNPVPALNGNYVQVFRYKGAYMTANIGDLTNSEEMVITDSAIIWIPDGFNFLPYKGGQQSGNKVTYIVTGPNKTADTIQIKILGGEWHMQLWKWPHHGGSDYALMVPEAALRSFPEINAVNSRSLDGNMDVVLDGINYDSLMSTK